MKKSFVENSYIVRSFGVALWELASFGATPYAELTNEQVLSQVVTDRTAVLLRPQLPLSNIQRLYVISLILFIALLCLVICTEDNGLF